MYTFLRQIITESGFPPPRCWQRQDFRTNEVIIREGDRDQRIYLVEAGSLMVTSDIELDESRKVKPGIYTLDAGQVFGEFCLFNDQPRSATVTATSDGRLIAIDAGQLQLFMDAHPDAGYRIMKEIYQTVVERLHLTNKRVENLFAWGLKAHGIDKHL